MTLKEALDSGYCSLEDDIDFDDTPQGEKIACLKLEIERLNNIINKVKQQLLNKKDIVEKSKYFKLVYYTDWNIEHEWDKSIVDKIDEIINIIDEENK